MIRRGHCSSGAMVAWREIAEPGIAAQRQGKRPVFAWPAISKLTVPLRVNQERTLISRRNFAPRTFGSRIVAPLR
jgi:hypothetical protein